MEAKDWIILILPSVISVISIFISNYLGNKSTSSEHKLNVQEDTYWKYHIPIIQWLSRTNSTMWNYAYLIAIPVSNTSNLASEFILTHVSQNIEYAPKEVVTAYSEYLQRASNYEFYVRFNELAGLGTPVENSAQEIADLFDKIIVASLTEAKKLSNTLGYPDIAEPVLKTYERGIAQSEKNSRHLPQVTQEK